MGGTWAKEFVASGTMLPRKLFGVDGVDRKVNLSTAEKKASDAKVSGAEKKAQMGVQSNFGRQRWTSSRAASPTDERVKSLRKSTTSPRRLHLRHRSQTGQLGYISKVS